MDAMRFGFKQFAAAERGTVAVIAAFGLVPAIAALGLSVDLGRTFVVQVRHQSTRGRNSPNS